MIKRHSTSCRAKSAFTLVEIVVVIAIVTFLLALSASVLANALTIAKQRATQATITKVHGLLQQRVEAFNRALDRLNLAPSTAKLKRDLGLGTAASDKACEILVRKQIFQSRFPQNFYEQDITISASAPHLRQTESSALLYWLLTKSEIYGVSPVDESEFSTSEVRDTDGDGLLEFVDAWGHPLRFYRWPTMLFRSGNPVTAPGVVGPAAPLKLTDVDRTYASVLWGGLPAPPATAGEIDPLMRDPDDPTGELRRFVLKTSPPSAAVAVLTMLQNRFHTPNTYHAFFIVSAGPDNRLGLGEPFDYSGDSTVPAPDGAVTQLSSTLPALGNLHGQGRLAAISSYELIQNHPINDNITNRKR